MRAVRFHLSLPRLLLVRTLGRHLPWLYHGPLSLTALEEVPEPALPGPRWLQAAPVYAGVCGTDLGAITASTSPSMSPFNSFPAVLGHEMVARVTETGAEVDGFDVGQRIVADPFISCQMRGLSPCPACRQRRTALCERTAEGELAAGMIMGFCRDIPGSWGERVVLHDSHVFAVPAALSDEEAVLVEPLAIALHGVLQAPPSPSDRVLVIGGGTMGLCTAAALRLLDCGSHVTVSARYGFQRDLAAKLGADAVIDAGADEAVLGAAEEVAGARRYEPLIGRPVASGGFDAVYDCVGSRRSLDDALRVTAPRGAVVVIGTAGEIPDLDWSFVWARELRVLGSCGYSMEEVSSDLLAQGEGGGEAAAAATRRLHTFELAMALLQPTDLPLSDMVRHRFPLGKYREALQVSLDRGRTGAVKVVLDCQSA